MRRRLILVTLAVSTMITLAFVVPLGFLVQRTAEDRALDAARADAAAIVPSIVVGADPATVESAVLATASGRAGGMTVILPDGTTLGARAESTRLAGAVETGTSSIGDVAGGAEIVVAVASGPGELGAVRVFVDDGTLRRGQGSAWLALGAVGLVLIALSVFVADRLSLTVVEPARRLAAAARRLGQGDLDATVAPAGPQELVELGTVFNDLGAKVDGMLTRERELVAELSHRLRTPLTRLRLRLETVSDVETRTQLEGDVDELTDVVDNVIREARGQVSAAVGCDAAEIVRRRAAFWQVLAEDQERAWSTLIDDGPALVPVAESAFAAAFDVLMENVFAHTDDGVAIEIGCRRSPPDRVVVWVADGGPGIDPSALERGVSGAGSTGLGLDIARQLAETGGGAFVVDTSALGGARVEMRLRARST